MYFMNEHYFTENPTSEIKEKVFSYTIKNKTLNFTCVSGVFSFEQKIDKASELLIENYIPTGKSVLDVGCGYGAIGLFINSIFPEQRVHLIDINSRALEYTAKNAFKNNLNVNTFRSDLFSDIGEAKYDDIVSNPPIAAGKKVYTQLINESLNYLNPSGALWIVAFHNKGGSTLKEIMRSRFGNVEDIVKSGGIRVYKSINSRAVT
jgi:16S rRNA (guanine1207-N2)-methyltransferase